MHGASARSAVAACISGQLQGVNLMRPVNLRMSRKMVPQPEPSSWQPWIAELHIPEKSLVFL
eukprot:350318-Chlamydomonas_euryale.AAC.2